MSTMMNSGVCGHAKKLSLFLNRVSSRVIIQQHERSKASFGPSNVPQSSQVIICGAGAVGNSVAYHMNQNGWKDIIVLEQSKYGPIIVFNYPINI